MRNVKPLVLACTALWGAMICNVASADDTVPMPGNGYSNDKDQALDLTCLNSAPPTVALNPSRISLIPISLADVEDQLNIKYDPPSSPGSHTGLDAFNPDLNAQLTSKLTTDNLSETVVYGSVWNFGFTQYNPPATGSFLNSTGAAAIQKGVDYFRSVCGDSFVTQIHQSSYFYMIYQFHFLTTADKQNFDYYLRYSFNNLPPFTQSMQDLINQYHIKGNIQILGYQVGGLPQYLRTLINSSVSTCDFSNVLACNPVASNIVSYFYGTTGTNYSNQFNELGPDGLIPVNAAVTEADQITYGSQFKSKSQLTPEITAMRDKLGTLLETTQNYLQRAKYLQASLPSTYNYQAFQQNLATQISNLEDNVQLLQDAGENCFNNLSSCIDTANTNISRLNPIKKAAFIAPETLNVITTVSGQPTTEQLFVAVDTTNPQDQTFHGNQITATPVPYPGAMPSNAAINMNGPDINITWMDPNTGAINAVYGGGLDTTNHYSGTVNYRDGSQGTWTAVLTPADTGTQ